MSRIGDDDGAILLLHGLIGTLDDVGILRAFGERMVLTPPLLGYGAHRNEARDGLSLSDQVEHVAALLETRGGTPVHVVGHSVGGAIGVLLTVRHPELVRSLTSVEGNLAIDDAFWSAGIARQPLDEVETLLEGYRADLDGWLAGAGVAPDDRTRRVAGDWLDAQPAATVRLQARAVVEATDGPSWRRSLSELVGSATPLHLIAGARSVDGWHVPIEVRRRADTFTVIPDVGHLMMLESPDGFARAVLGCPE